MGCRPVFPATIALVILICASVSDAQDSDWTGVIGLRPGQEVVVRADPAIDGRRSVVFADDRELVVLYLRHPSLADQARRRLRDMSIDQPTSLLASRGGQVIVGDRTISVGAGVISQSGRVIVPLQECSRPLPAAAFAKFEWSAPAAPRSAPPLARPPGSSQAC